MSYIQLSRENMWKAIRSGLIVEGFIDGKGEKHAPGLVGKQNREMLQLTMEKGDVVGLRIYEKGIDSRTGQPFELPKEEYQLGGFIEKED